VARRERLALAGIVVVAAALRLYDIGHQSFWLDESYTVDLVQRPFGDMLSGVADLESTPPLYYVLAWLWQKAFGHGEAGLRSLSALFGTLAVPVTWRAAREWFDDAPRAGLIAAALVAFNPFFVWYSQEARSYSLLVLMAALSVLFLARRRPAAWAITAVLALCTHYFAVFLVVPEAIWLALVLRNRRTHLSIAAVAVSGIALAPLALHQRDLGHTSFIADLSLKNRLVDLPKKLVTGELGTPTPLIGPLAGAIAALALVYALRQRPARVLTAIAAAAVLVPLVATFAGADYLLPRNLIAVYVPVVLAVAAGLRGRLGLAGAVVICAVALTVNLEVASDAKLQRDDWRGAAKALGKATETRVVIVTPDYAKKPLRLYAGSLPELPPSGADVREVVIIDSARPPKDPAPPPGFTEVSRVRTPSYVLVRYRSQAPARVGAAPALIQKGPTQ
jgi:mannosyltransferase